MSAPAVGPAAGRRGTAIHQASLYGSHEEFLATAVPFVTGGVETGEAVLVATTGANLDLLADALADHADGVDYAETGYFGRRPHQRVLGFRDYWARNTSDDGAGGGARHVRILAEPVWGGRSRRDVAAWMCMESGLNVLLADTSIWMICPYDRRTVDPQILEAAAQTHPDLVVDHRASPSPPYVEPHEFVAQCQSPLPPVPAHAVTMPAPVTATRGLRDLRRFVADRVEAHGLTERRAELAVMAVHEVVTYLLEHVPGVVTLRIWEEFNALVCDVHSTGQGLEDPFIGHRPPRAEAAPDDGVWLARQLTTHLETRSTGHGSVVRLHLPGPRDEEWLHLPFDSLR